MTIEPNDDQLELPLDDDDFIPDDYGDGSSDAYIEALLQGLVE